MLGAIIGDIVGSRFEFNNYRNKEFELFAEGCFVTDDSIMTLAVAKAIMEAMKVRKPSNCDYDHDFHAWLSNLTVRYMQDIGRKYPNCGFGGMFYNWIFSDDPTPYGSFGNGAAMRVSPVGFVARSKRDAEHLAETVTAVTHNHYEGIKGATATAVAIYLARNGALKSEIRECITRDYYPLDFKIDNIRSAYHFNETCQDTVPQAIECFLESTSFEDSIRTAISLGGDSDTIAAITGAIAEAHYGVPKDIKEKALAYLNEDLRKIYDDWTVFTPPSGEQFKVLTKYIGRPTAVDMDGRRPIEFDGIEEKVFRESYSDTEQFLKTNHPKCCAKYYGNEAQQDVRQGSVITFPDFGKLKASVEKLRTELSMLVLERDELVYVECKNIEMAYMLVIGGLEYKAYEIECAILLLKRKVELIQAKKNRQEKFVLSKIEELLDIEFAEYRVKLNEQIDKMNAALDRNNSESLSEEETRELKKLYRTIIKSLHPDINPGLSKAKIQLFYNAVTAYENGDINGLRIISVMVTKSALTEEKPDVISQLMKEKGRLLELLQTVKANIEEIKSEYPYTMKSLVQSSEMTQARKAELEISIKQLNETLAAYKAKIEEMLR